MVSSVESIARETAPARGATTVSTYLLDSLYHMGVQHIFGVPGDYVLRFDKRIEQHSIKFINATRENTAGFLADAYSRVKGMGVACITYGVGVSIVNSLSQAYVESSPVVVISGAPGKAEFLQSPERHHLINRSRHSKSDLTQLEMFRQVTIDQVVLDDVRTAASQIDRILARCQQTKKPVYIEIPRDLVDQSIPPHRHQTLPIPKSDPGALQEALWEIGTVLKHSKKPFLWIGRDVQSRGLAPIILQFAEKHQIPIVSTLLGKGVINEHHPLFVGVYMGGFSRPEVIEFVDSCDCAILLGVILSDMETGNFSAKLEHGHRITLSPTTVAIDHHEYPKVRFEDCIEKFSHLNSEVRYQIHHPQNRERKGSPFVPMPSHKITSQRTFECLQKHLKPDHIIVTDIGDSLFGSSDLMVSQNGFISSAYYATMGFGVPGAIAVQMAAPKHRVIGVVGDGAFQMTATELSTAVRYQIDPIIILLNNQGYGSERPLLEGSYNDILNWNYSEIPAVFGGGVGVKVTTEEELERALTKALENRGFFHLIEVALEKNDFSIPMKRFTSIINKSI